MNDYSGHVVSEQAYCLSLTKVSGREAVDSLRATFAPEEARRLIDKLEIHYTPKHGSWLNMAEIELGVLQRQCLDRRMADLSTLQTEVAAWQQARNAQQVKVHWQFSTGRQNQTQTTLPHH